MWNIYWEIKHARGNCASWDTQLWENWKLNAVKKPLKVCWVVCFEEGKGIDSTPMYEFLASKQLRFILNFTTGILFWSQNRDSVDMKIKGNIEKDWGKMTFYTGIPSKKNTLLEFTPSKTRWGQTCAGFLPWKMSKKSRQITCRHPVRKAMKTMKNILKNTTSKKEIVQAWRGNTITPIF